MFTMLSVSLVQLFLTGPRNRFTPQYSLPEVSTSQPKRFTIARVASDILLQLSEGFLFIARMQNKI